MITCDYQVWPKLWLCITSTYGRIFKWSKRQTCMEFQALFKYEVTEIKYELDKLTSWWWPTSSWPSWWWCTWLIFAKPPESRKTQAEAKSKTSAGVPILLRSIMGCVVNITTTSNQNKTIKFRVFKETRWNELITSNYLSCKLLFSLRLKVFNKDAWISIFSLVVCTWLIILILKISWTNQWLTLAYVGEDIPS